MYRGSVRNQSPLVFTMCSLSSLFILGTKMSLKLAAILQVFIYILINPFMAYHRYIINLTIAVDLFRRPLISSHFIFNNEIGIDFVRIDSNILYAFGVTPESSDTTTVIANLNDINRATTSIDNFPKGNYRVFAGNYNNNGYVISNGNLIFTLIYINCGSN